jgi:hypothetical protein
MKTISKEALQNLTADYLAKFEREASTAQPMRRKPYNYIVQADTLTIHQPYQNEENVEADQIKENDLLSGNEDVGKAEDADDGKVELQVASKSLKQIRKAMQKKTQDIKKRPKAKFSTTESSDELIVVRSLLLVKM